MALKTLTGPAADKAVKGLFAQARFAKFWNQLDSQNDEEAMTALRFVRKELDKVDLEFSTVLQHIAGASLSQPAQNKTDPWDVFKESNFWGGIKTPTGSAQKPASAPRKPRKPIALNDEIQDLAFGIITDIDTSGKFLNFTMETDDYVIPTIIVFQDNVKAEIEEAFKTKQPIGLRIQKADNPNFSPKAFAVIK